MLPETLNRIHVRIREACLRSERSLKDVQLLAVSKTRSPEEVRSLLDAGQCFFGENRVQEARDKISQLSAQRSGHRMIWHLIGPLQRNKVRTALSLFQMIQSVDSVALAREIERRSVDSAPMPVLIQVNIGREPQKRGVLPENLEATVRAVAEFEKVSIRGLMALPPMVRDPEAVRPHFRRMADWARKLEQKDISRVMMKELSMGMSHDFEVAIEEGATIVRIGSALFGPRALRDAQQ